jgi:transcriptional antiterminator NusG
VTDGPENPIQEPNEMPRDGAAEAEVGQAHPAPPAENKPDTQTETGAKAPASREASAEQQGPSREAEEASVPPAAETPEELEPAGTPPDAATAESPVGPSEVPVSPVEELKGEPSAGPQADEPPTEPEAGEPPAETEAVETSAEADLAETRAEPEAAEPSAPGVAPAESAPEAAPEAPVAKEEKEKQEEPEKEQKEGRREEEEKQEEGEEEEEEKSDELDWYILKVQSNREDSIREALLRRVKIAGLEQYFGDIIVPTEQVTEFKGGRKRVMTRKLYPGYLVIQMEINEDTWFLVRETPGIGDFTGAAGHPTPMQPHEVSRILARQEDKGEEAPKLKIAFRPGDHVKINEGTFENFEGDVDSIDETNGRVTVMINIFGRSTPVELEYWQIESI